VKAHSLVCFLAYAMWKTLAGWMRGTGLGDALRTLLYDLAKIKSGDIVLPAETREGVQKMIRLRHVTDPATAQSVLLYRLGCPWPDASDASTNSCTCSEDSTPKSHLSPYPNVIAL
jgi:hypothetical protein